MKSIKANLTLFALCMSVGVVFSSSSYSQADTAYYFDDEANHEAMPNPEWFKKSFYDLKEDVEEAKQHGKQGLIFFIGAENCSYCKIFYKKTLSEKYIKDKLLANFDIVGLEIFSNEEITDFDGKVYSTKEFVYHKNAQFSPTLIFYNTQGKQVLKVVGYYPPDKFAKILDYVIQKKYQKISLAQYLKIEENKNSQARRAIPRDKLFSYTNVDLAKNSEKPLVILLERDNCEACVRLHKNILSDAFIRNKLADFDRAQVDIEDTASIITLPDGTRSTPYAWARQLNLQYTPAFLFFDKSRKLVLRQESDVQKFRVKRMLKYAKEEVYLGETQFNRWLDDELRRKKLTYENLNEVVQ